MTYMNHIYCAQRVIQAHQEYPSRVWGWACTYILMYGQIGNALDQEAYLKAVKEL